MDIGICRAAEDVLEKRVTFGHRGSLPDQLCKAERLQSAARVCSGLGCEGWFDNALLGGRPALTRDQMAWPDGRLAATHGAPR